MMPVVTQRLVRIGRFLLIGTLFVSLGGHLVVLQTIAWGNMLREFARSAPLEEAARKTFDGEHPCALCKVVSESRKQEEKKPQFKAASKMDMVLPVAIRLKFPQGEPFRVCPSTPEGGASQMCPDVPHPPPRAA